MRWTHPIRTAFLMPAVVWVLIFTIFPLGYSLYAAFHKITNEVIVERVEVPRLNADGTPSLRPDGTPRMRTEVRRESVTSWEYVGFENFRRIARDSQVAQAVRVTLIFVFAAVTTEVILGLALAYLFHQTIPLRPILRTVMILPIFATPVAAGYLFFTIFYEEGGPLGWTGIPFLSDPNWALASIIMVDIWQWTPFCFLVFLAGLQAVPEDQIEAATLDTNSNWDIWREVIIPALMPVIVIVTLLRLVEAVKVFDVVASLTVGGPGNATQSVSYLAFRTGLRFFDVGYASVMAYMLLAFVMVIVTILFKRVRQIYA